ncbi:phage protein [Pseudomonas sp. HK3]
MSHQHIAGKNVHVFLDGAMITIDKVTLKITDNMEVQKTNGIPDGYVDGDVAAGGEITMAYKYFKLITAMAAKAGSYRALKPFDMDFIGATVDDLMPVKAHGCKIKLDSILDVDKNDKKKGMVTLPYEVTSPRFVDINGVPYLSQEESIGVY